jgi:hypothetical protein
VRAGSGVETVSTPNGGDEGPVGGDKGGVSGHELSDPRGQARNHSNKGRAVAVVAATVRLPKRCHVEEAEPTPEGLGIRRRAPGPAVICEEHRHRHGGLLYWEGPPLFPALEHIRLRYRHLFTSQTDTMVQFLFIHSFITFYSPWGPHRP